MRVTVKFTKCNAGWIYFEFHPEGYEKISLHSSYLFNDLNNLVHWVEQIDNHASFAEVVIDEEGHYMTFTARNINTTTTHLKIIGSYGDICYLDRDIDSHYFVESFKNEFCRFFLEDFDSYQWDKFGCDKDDEEWNREYYESDFCSRDGFREGFLKHEWLKNYSKKIFTTKL